MAAVQVILDRCIPHSREACNKVGRRDASACAKSGRFSCWCGSGRPFSVRNRASFMTKVYDDGNGDGGRANEDASRVTYTALYGCTQGKFAKRKNGGMRSRLHMGALGARAELPKRSEHWRPLAECQLLPR